MAPPHALGLGSSPVPQTVEKMNPEPKISWQQEIEYHISSNSNIRQAKVLNLADQDAEPKWAVIVSLQQTEGDTTMLLKDARKSLIKFKKASGNALLIIPKQWLVLQEFPITATGAIDELELRLSLAPPKENTKTWKGEVASLVNEMKSAPSVNQDSMRRLLALFWARALDIEVASIDSRDSFIAKGGNSVNVIQLAALAQENNIGLSAGQIFQYPRLEEMASVASISRPKSTVHAKPFELLHGIIDNVDELLKEIQGACSLESVVEIEDVLPCSPLQEGLMVEEMKFPGTYTSHHIHRLPAEVDLDRFRAAWERTVDLCANLRTRMVRVHGHTLQVVLKQATGWYSTDELSAWQLHGPATLPHLERGLGQSLCRYGVAQKGTDMYFVWSLHHATYDGWTMGIITDVAQQLYENLDCELALTPHSAFIQSLKNVNEEKAVEYWRREMKDVKPSIFPPPLPVSKKRKRAIHSIHTHSMTPNRTSSITQATILRAAWGILLAKYSDSDDICFGQVHSGRQSDLRGIEKMPGLTLATIPAHIHLTAGQPIKEMLNELQKASAEAIEFEQFGLSNIAKVSADAKEACNFTSLLAIQPFTHEFFQNGPKRLISLENAIEGALSEYLNYTLSLQVETRADSFATYFTFDGDVFCDRQIEALTYQYAHIVEQLNEPGSLTVGDLSVAGDWDAQQVRRWNSETVAEPVDACLHELLSEALQARPENTAIVTTAGSMSNKTLDTYSTLFAQYLVLKGVKEGMIVPFLFEKSMWAIVAIVAILKAGAAFLPLDSSYPATRRQMLIEETEAEVMVVSPLQRKSCNDLLITPIELSQSFFVDVPAETSEVSLPKVSPSSPVYCFFTSGSTGKPKGIVLEHAAVSMSMLAHIKAYGITKETRMLQFSSYMFDVTIIETFGTLIAGGTVCSPTDEERLYDCTSFMNSSHVNFTILTPTFARTLNPRDLKTLKTLVMGAEAISKDAQDMWYGRVKLMFGYGPTEAAVSNTMLTVESPDTQPTMIGKGFNTDCWIVEPDDHNRLTPVGCVGELVLHGHCLARGYLKNEAATEKSFLKDIDWMPRCEGDTRRFYKTGDLVRFSPDGNIEFVSRKDTQIKIRGRRIELGEVETAIKIALPAISGVAVEVLRLETREFLAAFIQSPESGLDTDEAAVLPVDDRMVTSMTALISSLNETLPPYMIPSMYIPISNIPRLQSMKTDRKSLRSMGMALTSKQLTEYSFQAATKTRPSTEKELKLRDLWANVLNRDAVDIGKHDSFLAIGGDSIAAMELVSQARKLNMSLTVQDVFRKPKLCDLALTVGESFGEKREIEAFGLLPEQNRDSIIKQVKESIQLLPGEKIIDIYPSTPMQERLIAAAEKTSGSYVALHSFKVLRNVDMDRFISAWNMTVNNSINLRTRLVSASGKTWQTVLETRQPCISKVENVRSTSDARAALLETDMIYGTPLCRANLVRDEEGITLILAMQHSIFDGWSINILLMALHDAYTLQRPRVHAPYTAFIDYIQLQDEGLTKEFWIGQLDGAKQSMFPRRGPTTGGIHDPRLLVRSTSMPPLRDSSITVPSIVRAAWAIVLSRHCATDDVCFSDTMSGRLAAVDGIEHMPGLTISIIPFRVHVNDSQQVKSLLQDVQKLATEIIPHEQYGLHNIAKLCTGFKEAIDCGHVLVIQPAQSIEAQLQQLGAESVSILEPPVSEDEGLLEAAARYDGFPLIVNCQMLESSLRISYIYNTYCMSEKEASELSAHLETAIHQLIVNPEQTVGHILPSIDGQQKQSATDRSLPEVFPSVEIQRKKMAMPANSVEAELRELWASALSLEVEDISSEDNFFLIGGDSFSAIQLASQARRNGLQLTARTVFQTPVLADMAVAIGGENDNVVFTAPPFSLLGTNDVGHFVASVAKLCDIEDVKSIEDVYPCTAMQEGLMSLTVTQPGSYINKVSIPLRAEVDIHRFKNAWNQVISLYENTRTRIVLVDGKAFQVIVKEEATWSEQFDLDVNKIGYGSRLCYYSIESTSDGTGTFSFMMHHSIYDGWVFSLVFQALENFYYRRGVSPPQPFSGFVKYINSIDEKSASAYWKTKLCDAIPSSFPSRPKENCAERQTKTWKRSVAFTKNVEIPVTNANFIRTAWALVLERYSGTERVCFGSTVSGRQASVAGLEQMPGPMIATIPFCVAIDRSKRVMDLLAVVQNEASNDAAYEQFGLQNIAKLGTVEKSACDFTSLLIIQAANTTRADDKKNDKKSGSLFFYQSVEDVLDEEASQNFFNYPLVAQCFSGECSIDLLFTYDSSVVAEDEIVAFSNQFQHVLQQVFSHPQSLLSDVSFVCQWDKDHALENSNLRPASAACVHGQFEQQVELNGNIPAVNSWDATFTYAELYKAARPLAVMLQQRGIGPNVVVPVCFVKSAWAVVAMLGIQMAGGAFVPLDPEAPIKRLETLIADVSAPLILASKSCFKKLASFVAVDILIINEDAITALPQNALLKREETGPADCSFIIFTSGTTGKPKGVEISHSAICSSADGYGESLKIGPGTRVFQFSSYIFDVGILDILVTLMRGGCVCVPSDYSRIHELAESINSTQANWVFLTPTIANLLSPHDVPSLKTVCLGGEAVGEAVANKWKNSVDLHGLYGPAESSICSWKPRLGYDGKSTNIGHPLLSAFWVVDPANPKEMVPVGCMGELLIQGPLLARGYRNATAKDEAKWLENIDWLPGSHSGRGYLTGDLVRRNADGTFDYMGRKDSQLKLRGQRIETGEIEFHLSSAIQGVKQVAVDIVESGSTKALAAFVDFGTGKPSDKEVGALFAEALEFMSLRLPAALRPQYFIPLDDIPQTSTGKLDRRALKATLSALNPSDLLKYSVSRDHTSRKCQGPLELEIQGYWSRVLGVPASSIGATDNFYSLGGDSIRIVSLVQLIKAAHGDGIGLSVFGSSKTTIETMARAIETQRNGAKESDGIMHDFYGEITSAIESLSDIETLQHHCCTILPQEATIFLTGATGYLGTELLHESVKQDQVATVVVLARADTVAHGVERVKMTAEIAGWWMPEYEAKIEVWLGDLGKDQLGLSAGQYSRLLGLSTAGNMDAIIHNGAVVNWSADFHALKAENITSTIRLLQATIASPRQPKFIFVSGGTGSKRNGTQSAREMCNELAHQNGYSQTKFISESIVCELANKLPADQNRIAVVKPGLIIGTASFGVANVDDFLWRLVAASVALRQAPQLDEGQDWVQLAAVDEVAAAIIRPLFSHQGVDAFTEITNGISMNELWKIVGEETGLELMMSPYAKWLEEAQRQMGEMQEKHPLWAVQDFLERPKSATQVKEVLPEILPHAATRDAIKSSVRYLQRIGFIQKSAADFGRVDEATIGRSSLRTS